jgi:hypothetical protein
MSLGACSLNTDRRSKKSSNVRLPFPSRENTWQILCRNGFSCKQAAVSVQQLRHHGDTKLCQVCVSAKTCGQHNAQHRPEPENTVERDMKGREGGEEKVYGMKWEKWRWMKDNAGEHGREKEWQKKIRSRKMIIKKRLLPDPFGLSGKFYTSFSLAFC